MKTFNSRAAQGEIQIRRVDHIPEGCKPVDPAMPFFVIGHSETGHHHVIRTDGASISSLVDPPAGMQILYAILTETNALEHQRAHDTHLQIHLPPGMYEFRICREFDPYLGMARGQED